MRLYFNNQRVLVHLGSKLYEPNIGSPMASTVSTEPADIEYDAINEPILDEDTEIGPSA